jgi:hypothetical protein
MSLSLLEMREGDAISVDDEAAVRKAFNFTPIPAALQAYSTST